MMIQWLDDNVRNRRRPAYVIVVVLIVIVVLALAAYRYSDMMMAEYRATDRILKSAQAKALADSGLHYTIALLSDQTAFSGTLASNPYDNAGYFQDISAPVDGQKGRFSIVVVDYSQDPGNGSLPSLFGVADESGKLNLNTFMQIDPSGQKLHDALMNMNLLGMTDDIAWSIVDWIDADSNTSSGGAEDDYYMSISPPYHCKNAPLDSVEELLLVKGITPALLYGSDLNRNGQNDPEENSNGVFGVGWLPYFTVYSREQNVDSSGNPRINVNGKNLQNLYQQLKTAVGDQLAAAIMAYRIYSPAAATDAKAMTGSPTQLVTVVEQALNGQPPPRSQRNVSSIFQLIGSKVTIPGNMGMPSTIYPFPIQDVATARDLLPTAIDKLTTVNEQSMPGRINVNTASSTVLLALPGLEQADVDTINGVRPAPGSSDALTPLYQSVAWLYTEANITAVKMEAIERYITARTQVYHIQSIGYFDKGGPVVRVEAVVDTNQGQPRILYYRDLTELGRAIDPRTN